VKIATIIFSVYILILSSMPCNDNGLHNYNNSNHSSASSIIHEAQSSQSENCTPFCFCDCCGISCNYQSFKSKMDFIIPAAEQNNSFYKSTVLLDVSFSIWQPPKIS